MWFCLFPRIIVVIILRFRNHLKFSGSHLFLFPFSLTIQNITFIPFSILLSRQDYYVELFLFVSEDYYCYYSASLKSFKIPRISLFFFSLLLVRLKLLHLSYFLYYSHVIITTWNCFCLFLRIVAVIILRLWNNLKFHGSHFFVSLHFFFLLRLKLLHLSYFLYYSHLKITTGVWFCLFIRTITVIILRLWNDLEFHGFHFLSLDSFFSLAPQIITLIQCSIFLRTAIILTSTLRHGSDFIFISDDCYCYSESSR